jgi:hypothetical protein
MPFERPIEIRPSDTAIPPGDDPVPPPPLVPRPQRRARHVETGLARGQPGTEAIGRWLVDVADVLASLSARLDRLERGHD